MNDAYYSPMESSGGTTYVPLPPSCPHVCPGCGRPYANYWPMYPTPQPYVWC